MSRLSCFLLIFLLPLLAHGLEVGEPAPAFKLSSIPNQTPMELQDLMDHRLLELKVLPVVMELQELMDLKVKKDKLVLMVQAELQETMEHLVQVDQAAQADLLVQAELLVLLDQRVILELHCP